MITSLSHPTSDANRMKTPSSTSTPSTFDTSLSFLSLFQPPCSPQLLTLITEWVDRDPLVIKKTDSQLGQNALHVCAKNKDVPLEVASLLLHRHVNMNAKDHSGRSPLHICAETNNTALADLLINKGADVEALDGLQRTPLHTASVTGSFEMTELLISKTAKLVAMDAKGLSPVHLAAMQGHVTVLTLLLRYVDVNTPDNSGRTPVHMAALSGSVECLVYLLEQGANVNASSKNGWTPLHSCAAKNQVETARILCEKGASIEAMNEDGCSPLYVAVWFGALDILRYLVDKGANIFFKNQKGLSALHLCAAQNKVHIAEYLVSKGIPLEERDASGCTPLYISCFNGSLQVTEFLLSCGADINAADYLGRTPLHVVGLRDHAAVAQVLIAHGANLMATDVDLQSPLHVAAWCGGLETVKLLMEGGAELHAADKNGESPLKLSIDAGHTQVAEVIKEGYPGALRRMQAKLRGGPTETSTQNPQVFKSLMELCHEMNHVTKSRCTEPFKDQLDHVKQVADRMKQILNQEDELLDIADKTVSLHEEYNKMLITMRTDDNDAIRKQVMASLCDFCTRIEPRSSVVFDTKSTRQQLDTIKEYKSKLSIKSATKIDQDQSPPLVSPQHRQALQEGIQALDEWMQQRTSNLSKAADATQSAGKAFSSLTSTLFTLGEIDPRELSQAAEKLSLSLAQEKKALSTFDPPMEKFALGVDALQAIYYKRLSIIQRTSDVIMKFKSIVENWKKVADVNPIEKFKELLHRQSEGKRAMIFAKFDAEESLWGLDPDVVQEKKQSYAKKYQEFQAKSKELEKDILELVNLSQTIFPELVSRFLQQTQSEPVAPESKKRKLDDQQDISVEALVDQVKKRFKQDLDAVALREN